MKTFKIISLTMVCLLLGVTIAWQFTSVKQNLVLAQYEKKNINQIIDELLLEKSNNDKLKVRLQELQNELDGIKNKTKGDKDYVAELEQQILNARIMAGLETVKGKGLVLLVEQLGDRSIDDTNIEELLNELKATDVQAISVNDERIVATSEIRTAGDYIMINGRQLGPPYTIKAIGDPDLMERSLKLLGGVLSRFEYYEFNVEITKEQNVVIPGVRSDTLRIDKLTPVE